MGYIHESVKNDHLNRFPDEYEILYPFLDGFDVTWGRRRVSYNTSLSVYFLNPSEDYKEMYGFDTEIALIYAPYGTMEARTMQAASRLLEDDPARGRVEKLSYILVSDDREIRNWLDSYLLSQQESKTIIAISKLELLEQTGSKVQYLKNQFDNQFYRRDLFNNNSFLPLVEDAFFFGRQKPLVKHIKAISRRENRGVFGLRKTGKTSFLFKVGRDLKDANLGTFVFIDCKSHEIRSLDWKSLLAYICEKISIEAGVHISKKQTAYSPDKVVGTFKKVVEKTQLQQPGHKLVIVFDEIEYISPVAILDPHWHKDFIHFFGVIWSTQQACQNLTMMVAGVNPSVVEVNKFGGVPNPLFSIVTPYYLQGFSEDEVRVMIESLGGRMGLLFDEESMKDIYNRYGGHPSLTRRACSFLNEFLEDDGLDKPINIDLSVVQKYIHDIDVKLIPYCNEVVSELEQFYEDEFEMLEMLCSGQVLSYMDLAIYPEITAHLKSYGLVSSKDDGTPFVSIEVVRRYVALNLSRKENRKGLYKVVPDTNRKNWIQSRTKEITNGMRSLEKLIQQSRLPSLYGVTSFSEADIFVESEVVSDKATFINFINSINRSFVESLSAYGVTLGKRNYFWDEIRDNFPALFEGLYRINLYRNEQDHLVLKDFVNENLQKLIALDLDGLNPTQVPDIYFTLQQRVIDGLLIGIKIETERLM